MDLDLTDDILPLLERLFAEARAQVLHGDPSQAPAIQCHLLLRGQPQPIFGSLSMTPEGMLRMLTPTRVQHPGDARAKDILLEQFFRHTDLLAIMIEREIHVERSRIIGA